MRPPRFPALDGLRALAALSVLAYHVFALTGHSQHSLVLAQLKAGLALFFVLSGCVVYLPFAQAIAGERGLPAWRAFARRRAARILPAYWLVLAVWLPLSGLGGPASDWWRYLGLVQSYEATTFLKGLGVAWTLCVEVAFYAALPCLAHGLARLARRARDPHIAQLAALATLAGLSLALRATIGPASSGSIADGDVPLASSLPFVFDWFAGGMALAVLVSAWSLRERKFAAARALRARPWLCWSLSLAAFALAIRVQDGDVLLSANNLAAHVLTGLACIAAVLPALDARDHSLLASRPLVWLGTVSYGIYLWHLPVLMLARRAITGLHFTAFPHGPLAPHVVAALAASTALGAVALATLSWHAIERPALALARRRSAPVRGPEPVAAQP